MTEEQEKRVDDRFRILVCIDGSDEGYRGLKYAVKLGGGVNADIVLLYVRPIDQGLRSGGLQVSVVRENMLKWGLELPGLKHLKRGRDMLVELGALSLDWQESHVHTDVAGTSLGDNKIDYLSETGQKIVLKLKVAPNIVTGILDQWELGEYDLIILGASERWRERTTKSFTAPAVAEKIAKNAPCSVIVARELAVGNGHLICVDGSPHSLDAVRRDAYIASRCNCDISLISVARHEKEKARAEEHMKEAVEELKALGVTPVDQIIRIGDAVDQVVDVGPDYSLRVVADTGKGAIERFFSGSVAFDIVEKSYNSVMVIR